MNVNPYPYDGALIQDTYKSDKCDKYEKPEKCDKYEKPDKCDKYDKFDKPEKCDKYDKYDEYDKYGKRDECDKYDKHDKPHKHDCDQDAFQFVDISVPVEICPDVKLGKIETECCGEPYIQCEHEPCGSNCSIIVTQSVKIKIPVKFDIKTIEGNGFIKCCDCCDK